MKVLHVCSYYIGNKLYKNMIGSLAKKNINQVVYIPVRTKEHLNKNKLPSVLKNIKFQYSKILNKFDRLFFMRKINKQKKDIERNLLSHRPDLIHAHTAFSDGGTAYLLHEKYGIKYILNVRNTDINYFYKYRIDLRRFMYQVLINSEFIIFISYAYKTEMLSLLPPNIRKKIKSKCYVIPNGIDDYWHEKALTHKKYGETTDITLLFIGEINGNKNLETVLYTCENIKNRGYNVFLNIVGEGPQKQKNKDICLKLKLENDIKFHGYITDKNKIAAIMDSSDIFIMPSIKETFGLVYIEAMTRGLPIIYTEQQGVDGFFHDSRVGFAVSPKDEILISNAVIHIMNNYTEYSRNCINEAQKFQWDLISEKINQLYWKVNLDES